MNTLLFSLLLTTAVPDDLTVEQFLEMLQRTSEIFNNTQLVYEIGGQRLPEFESEEEMEEYLDNTSRENSSRVNESYKEIAQKGFSYSGKTLIKTRDFDTYRSESISRTGITNTIFVMDDNIEYMYDPSTNIAMIGLRSYRTRNVIPFLGFEIFNPSNMDNLRIEGNQINLMKNGNLSSRMEFNIHKNRIIPITVFNYSDSATEEYHFKEYDTINDHYLSKMIEKRSYQHGLINSEFKLTYLRFNTLTQLKHIDNIDDSEFDILIPAGTTIKDRRTRKEYIAEVDGEGKVSLVEFAKSIDEESDN